MPDKGVEVQVLSPTLDPDAASERRERGMRITAWLSHSRTSRHAVKGPGLSLSLLVLGVRLRS